MPFDPDNDVSMRKLAEATRWSYGKLRPYRENEAKFKKEFVGRYFSDSGAQKSIPVNDLEFAVGVFTRELAPMNPAVFARARDPALMPIASNLELAINQFIPEANVATALELGVLDAMFSMGIVTVGITEAGPGYGGVGEPYVEHIPLDDWVQDMAARQWSQRDYAGHRMRMTLEEIEALQGLTPEAEEQLSLYLGYGATGEGRSSDIGGVQQRDVGPDQLIRKYFDVWYLHLPKENVTLHLLDMQDERKIVSSKPLAVVDYKGPLHGPYHRLGFTWIPGMPMPLSPVATQFELFKVGQALWRKGSRQAENQKTVVLTRKGYTKDAEKIIKASDMEVVPVDNPDAHREMNFNGADGGTIAMARTFRDLFNTLFGNPELLAGTSAPTDTVGQDRMLNINASRRVSHMQDRVTKWVRGILTDLGYWLYTDPRYTIPLFRPIPGTDEFITVEFTPEDRQADFYKFNIDINPYSMKNRTPHDEYRTMIEIFQGIVLPFSEQLSAQNGFIDVVGLLRTASELQNFRSLDRFVKFTDDLHVPKAIGRPPQTVRQPAPARDGRTTGDRSLQDIASIMRMISSGNGKRSDS